MDATLTRIRNRHFIAIAASWLCLFGGKQATADAIPYRVTDLGTLPGASGALATGLNNKGQVVGESGNDNFFYNGRFMISPSNLDHNIGINDYGYAIYSPRDIDSTGINNVGVVVGNVGGTVPATQFDGTISQLPGFSNAATAVGINDAGQVVGRMSFVDPETGLTTQHPFLYTNGQVQDIGLLPGTTSATATDINNSGQVVGGQFGYSNGHAFLFSGGTLTDLGTLGGQSSIAEYINNSGQILGYSYTGEGRYDAFLYQNGKMIDLTELLKATTGLSIVNIAGLNDSGQIAANTLIDGQYHAYLLTPQAVPEPSVFWSAIAGISLWSFVRRIRRADSSEVAGKPS